MFCPPLNFEEPPPMFSTPVGNPAVSSYFLKQTCLKSEEICYIDSKEKTAKNEW